MSLLLAEIDWDSLLREDFGTVVLPIFVLLGTVGVIGLAAIIAPQWRKTQQAKSEARLKEQMIERGFTADDIIKVINAGVSKGRPRKTTDRIDCHEPTPC